MTISATTDRPTDRPSGSSSSSALIHPTPLLNTFPANITLLYLLQEHREAAINE